MSDKPSTPRAPSTGATSPGRRQAHLSDLTAEGNIIGSYTNSNVFSSLERLSQSDPTKVQEVVASQLALLVTYHNLVLDQARRSFRAALIVASAGFCFFVAAVGFLLLREPQSTSIVSLISGALIEVISGINFYLYGKTSTQLADFQIRLETIQRFVLANSVCEGLDGETKNQARAELVQAIARITTTQSK